VLYSDGNLERIESGNILLFSGMGLIGIGLVTMVVGLGEKGFKTMGLMMLGPCLVICGLLLVVFRVFLCTVGWIGGGTEHDILGGERKKVLDEKLNSENDWIKEQEVTKNGTRKQSFHP
jgi:hypothetical protein